jgi:hypothetical protein
MLFKNIRDGLILYVGRDNGFIVEYNYTLDFLKQKYYDNFVVKITEFKNLIDNIKNKTVPERDFRIALKNNKSVMANDFQKDNVKYKSDWHCSYCNYQNLCWHDVYEKLKNENYSFYINGEYIK